MPTATPLDAIDRKILGELQQQADLSLDALAERVSLSRNACWRRVRRLEEDGVIRARVTLLDPAKVGVPLSVLVMVRTSRHEAAWIERFRAAVMSVPGIVAAYRTTGDIDYVLHARVADVAAYDELYRTLTARVEMTDVSASFVMEEIKASTALPL